MFQLFFWRESERDHSPKGGNPTLARPKPPNVANLLMPKRKKKKKKEYHLAPNNHTICKKTKPPNVTNLIMPKKKKKKKKVYPLALFNLPFWIGLRYLLISLTREQFAW